MNYGEISIINRPSSTTRVRVLVAGHFVEAVECSDLGRMNYTLLGPLGLIKASHELFRQSPLPVCYSSTLRQQKDGG